MTEPCTACRVLYDAMYRNAAPGNFTPITPPHTLSTPHSTFDTPRIDPLPPYNPIMPESTPPQRTRRWQRPAAAALLLLAAGAIINFAAAWLCAAFVNPFAVPANVTSTPHSPTELLVESRLQRFGHTRIDRARIVAKRDEITGELSSMSWAGPINAQSDPVTGTLHTITWASDSAENISEVRAGWPLRCLAGFNNAEVTIKSGDIWLNMFRTGSGGYIDAIELPPFIGAAFGAAWRGLPLRPIWPGFIINTIFYALLLWLLFAIPFAVRRMLRRRRGVCERCAYPVGVSPVCTECGETVTPVAVA